MNSEIEEDMVLEVMLPVQATTAVTRIIAFLEEICLLSNRSLFLQSQITQKNIKDGGQDNNTNLFAPILIASVEDRFKRGEINVAA